MILDAKFGEMNQVLDCDFCITAHGDTSHITNKHNPHKVTAEQVGARPNTWTPTAEQVGARPNTWTPTADEVGARANTWLPTIEEIGAADYVIAQGTSGGWTYRKWASGIAECWINDFNYDGKSISAGGNSGNSLAFPFTFIDTNLTQYITVNHPDTPVRLSARFCGKVANHCITAVHNFGTTDVSGFTVDIHIIGRWK